MNQSLILHSLARERNLRGPRPAACDLCHLWKIRCNKQHPCAKCKALEVKCKYSRSGSNKVEVVKPDGVKTYKTRRKKEHIYTSLKSPNQIVFSELSGRALHTNLDNSRTGLGMFLEICNRNLAKPKKLRFDKNGNLSTSYNLKSLFKLNRLDSAGPFIKINENFNKRNESFPLFSSNKKKHKTVHSRKAKALGFRDKKDAVFLNINKSFPIKQNKNGLTFDVSDPSNDLHRELIELYFGCLNIFYPVIHPTTFLKRLCDKQQGPEFRALLYAVLLVGSSYLADFSQSQKLGIIFSLQLKNSIKHLYSNPCIEMVQVCTLITFYITKNNYDPIYSEFRIYAGVGHTMAIQLGLHANYRKRTHHINQTYSRVFWVLTNNETLINHCTGFSCGQVNDISPIPDRNTVFPSINVTSENTMIERVLKIPSFDRNFYFVKLCEYTVLLSHLKFPEFLMPSNTQQSLSISNFSLARNSHLRLLEPVQTHLSSIEMNFFKWFQNIPDFNQNEVRDPESLSLPHEDDILGNKLFIYFMAILVDINKINSEKTQNIDSVFNILFFNFDISCQLLKDQCPLGKCILATHLAAEAINNSRMSLPNIEVGYYWYCVVQVVFFLSLTLEILPENHAVLNITLKRLGYMQEIMKKNADRFIIAKDCYELALPMFKKWLSVSFDSFKLL